MGLRPTLPQGEVTSDIDNVLGLTVERYVSGIAGSRQALEIGKNYTITYEQNPSNANQWTFTIEGADSDEELQKYSTSGKAWTYEVKEDPEKIPNYKSSGVWKGTSDSKTGDSLNIGSVTNTLYTNTLFTKAWQDKGGNSIKEDYLGFNLTVTFKLQVKPDSGTWQDASTYFTPNGCGLEELVLTSIKNAITTTGFTKNPDDPFRATLTGRIDSSVWGGTNRFNNLPTVIQLTGGSPVKLTYRVVEESVAYGSQSQTITVGNDGYRVVDKGLVDSAKLEGNKTTNTISTTSLTVEKVWEDSDNIYNTRPGGDNVMTWESWFVVQRSTNGTDWKNVEIVRLYGRDTKQDNTEHWSETISGLPVSDYSGNTSMPYTYRVRELQPKDGGYKLDENLSESIIEEDDKLLSGSGDYSVDYTEGKAVTEEAQGTDGANRTEELNAENDWKATFAELPKYDAAHALYYYYALELNAEGKPVENDGKITYGESDYRVSYVFEDGVTEITNRQIAALSGTKTWVDGSDEARPDTLELTLRRTTEPDAENPVWETVDLEAENITLTWTDTDTDVWTYTYTDLPLNAPNGDAYTYAVAERVPDGWDVYYADTVPVDEAPALDKAEEAGDAESGEDAEAASVPARDRYLTNVRRGNLTVEKAVDGAYGDHEQAFAFSAVFRLPEDFTGEADGVYGTYTTAGSDEAEPIEFTDGTAEVTFTLRDGERIEFAGLPGGTDYRIAETDAYGHLSTSTGETGEIPAGTTATAVFVNTREDDPFAGLRVLKTVSGTDGETDRAFHFTVTLADDSVNGTYGDMEFVNGAAQFTLRDGEVRTATGLPAGIGYTVTEEEANQVGYTTTVTGNTGTLEAGVTAQAAFDNARDKKAEPTPSAEPTPTAAPAPTAEPTPTPKPEESDAVQTGDETDLTVPSMLFLMSVSGLTAAVAVWRRRRRARGASRK